MPKSAKADGVRKEMNFLTSNAVSSTHTESKQDKNKYSHFLHHFPSFDNAYCFNPERILMFRLLVHFKFFSVSPFTTWGSKGIFKQPLI